MRRYRKFSTNPQEIEKISERDFPLIKRNIIAGSVSGIWEEACREWDYLCTHDEDSALFTDRCEICNHVGLRQNFEIYNIKTNKHFLVGRNCIQRFIILNGAETLEDSNVLLNIKIKEEKAIKTLQNLLSDILNTPTPRQLGIFRICCGNYLGNCKTPNDISPEKWKDFLFKLFGNNQNREKIDRIKNALFNQKAIPVKQVKLSSKKEQEKVGTWAGVSKVKSRVNMTLAESEVYKNPRKILEEKH